MGRQVKQPGRGARGPVRKVLDDEFLPAGVVGEEQGGRPFLLRDKLRKILFPVEFTLINASLKSQIEPGPMEMAPHNGNNPTQLPELFHLALLVVPPGPLRQTSPNVVPELFSREFIAIG